MIMVTGEKGEKKLVYVDEVGVVKYEIPGKWECLRCGGSVISEENPPLFCTGCERKSVFKSVTPPVFREPWRPYGEPVVFDDVNLLYEAVSGFIGDHLVLRNLQEQMIIALWIVASYRQQDFFTAPYLQFIGSVESGKTRALEVLEMLSFKAVNYISISPAALCREIEQRGVTVLLDQAEQKFSLRTERGCEMTDIFFSGYKRGQQYVVADKDDMEATVSRNVFGFKAIASTRCFDEALTSRSIVFRMKQGVPKVKDITQDSYVKAAEIRNTLLYYHLKPLETPLMNPVMSGRRRELFMPLLRVGKDFGIGEEDLSEFFEVDKEKMVSELSDTFEADLLREIKIIYHGIDEQERIMVGDLAMRLDVKPSVVGYRLKNMNIPRKHARDGAFIDLRDEKAQKELDYLFVKYHVE